MKTTNLKFIAIAFSALMLMQSCVAYHKTPVSVDEAVASQKKVKVYSMDDRKHKFSRLEKEGENIYGIKKIKALNTLLYENYEKEIDQKKGLVKILLPLGVKEVYTKSNIKSTIATITLILSPLLLYGTFLGLYYLGGGIY